MKMVMGLSGVPAATYQGVFVGIESTTNQYGEGYTWQWRITQEGPHKGKTVKRITGDYPTKTNACGKMLTQVSGRESLEANESINLADYVGKSYTIVVSPCASGGTRVESVKMVL
jgi:hypothetical protein